MTRGWLNKKIMMARVLLTWLTWISLVRGRVRLVPRKRERLPHSCIPGSVMN
jgi:hypothetical protein